MTNVNLSYIPWSEVCLSTILGKTSREIASKYLEKISIKDLMATNYTEILPVFNM